MLEENRSGLGSLGRDPTPVPVTVAPTSSTKSSPSLDTPKSPGMTTGGKGAHFVGSSASGGVETTGSVAVGVPVVAASPIMSAALANSTASPMVTAALTNPVLAAAAALEGFEFDGLSSGVGGLNEKAEFEDYESLPVSSMAAHMSAGALAGIMEHCVMYPLDSVKTRMQSLQPQPGGVYRNVMEALLRMIQTEGIFRPVRGMSVVVAGAGPAHAAYFACYERLKEVLASKTPSHYNHIAHGVAGSVATVLHDGVMTPADVVKQRMQMYNSPYSSVWNCIRKTYQVEGARAFYRSYTTQLTMNVPFQSIHFMVYEWMQGITNRERTYNPKAHMISGAMAGALAAAVTTPLDVCKTLLNTQESTALHSVGQSQISGLGHAFRTVYRLGGVKGYFQGATARVLYQMPSTAICWTVYEFMKYAIQQRG